MNSIKCAECGLVNFASATECKRCHIKFHKPETIVADAPVVSETAENDEVLNESPKNYESLGPLPPLPEYFDDEPAPFTTPEILFAVFLGLSILSFMVQLKFLFDFMGSQSYQLATDPGLALGFYNSSVEPMIYAEFILKGIELLAALALMFLLPGKSWAFLKWVRRYLFATALFQLAEMVGGLILRASFTKKMVIKPTQLEELEFGAGLVSAGVFILISLISAAYFEKSERVKKIFIN